MTVMPRPITSFEYEPSSPWMDGDVKPAISGQYQRRQSGSVFISTFANGVWYGDSRCCEPSPDQALQWRGMPGSPEDVVHPVPGFKAMGSVAERLRLDGHHQEAAIAWRMVAEARALINAAKAALPWLDAASTDHHDLAQLQMDIDGLRSALTKIGEPTP